MNEKKMPIVFYSLLLVVMLFFLSCDFNANETFAVWTDTSTYSEFKASFNTTLEDGMYLRTEFTKSQWKQISSSWTSSGKHNWTQDRIKDWFFARGFGDYEATKESAWLATIDHGIIATRTNNIVYYIFK